MELCNCKTKMLFINTNFEGVFCILNTSKALPFFLSMPILFSMCVQNHMSHRFEQIAPTFSSLINGSLIDHIVAFERHKEAIYTFGSWEKGCIISK